MYTVLLAVKQKKIKIKDHNLLASISLTQLFVFFILRNRSALAVNYCVIIHCLKVSCKDNQITSA